MKKYLELLVASILMFSLTGCVFIDTNVVINKDKSINFSMKEEIDLSAMEDMEGETSVSDVTDIEALKEKGYTIESYDNEGVIGYKISKNFSNIDDITDTTNSTTKFVFEKWFADGDDSNMFTLKDDIYSAHWIISEDVEIDDTEMEVTNVEMMNSLINITYTITLPNKPISHNATRVSEDGKTLTYEVKYDENQKMNDIQFSFDFNEQNNVVTNEIDNMLYYIIGGSALIIIILVVVIVSIIKGKNKKETNLNKVENVDSVNNAQVETIEQPSQEQSKPVEQPSQIQPRPMPQSGQAPQPRPMPQPGQAPQPRPMPQSGQAPQPRPMPQPGQAQQPRPMPQSGQAPQPRPMTQPSQTQQPRPMAQPGQAPQPRPMTQPSQTQQPRPMAQPSQQQNNSQQ